MLTETDHKYRGRDKGTRRNVASRADRILTWPYSDQDPHHPKPRPLTPYELSVSEAVRGAKYPDATRLTLLGQPQNPPPDLSWLSPSE